MPYKIGQSTMAITSSSEGIYKSGVLDSEDGMYFCTGTPLQLIKDACILHRATFEGRRECVIRYLGYTHKTPIPISPHHLLYALPTSSPKNFECVWLFLHQLKQTSVDLEDPKNTDITFHNGIHLIVNSPKPKIDRQIERTLACSARINLLDHFPCNLNQPSKTFFYSKTASTNTSSISFVADPKGRYVEK